MLNHEPFAVDPSWPFAWHASDGFYFRPESGGLLVCACDVEERCDGSAGTCPADALVSIGTECRAAAGPCGGAWQADCACH